MSTFLMYLERVQQGMMAYFKEDKSIVLLVTVLLLFWLKEKKTVDNKGNRLLLYTAIMTVVLLCPVTAAVILMYQTAFYDYAWAWSMVPVFAVTAYAGVVLYEEWKAMLNRKKTVLTVALVIVILFVCGNQGVVQKVEAKDEEERYLAEGIVNTVLLEGQGKERTLWGPRSIMQEVRRQTGDIKLVYGRDMWDEKSGAYDYEAYTEPYIEAYEWMELVALLSKEASGEDSFQMLCEQYRLMEKADSYVEIMVESKVNAIVVPKLAATYFGEVLNFVVVSKGWTITEINTQQYVVYLLQ